MKSQPKSESKEPRRYKKVVASFVWRLRRWSLESALLDENVKLTYEQAYALLLDKNPWLKQVPRRLVQPRETLIVLENMQKVLHEPSPSHSIKQQETKVETTNETNTTSPASNDANGVKTDSANPSGGQAGVQGTPQV